MDEQGILGGEGSGSVALPAFSRAFDGFLMMALVLEAMAEGVKTLSELISPCRGITLSKRVSCAIRGKVTMRWRFFVTDWRTRPFAGSHGRHEGGLGRWLGSCPRIATEQMIRVISEAKNRAVAERRADEISRVIEQEV